MARLTQSNYDNFLTWQKVNGGLSLTRLQARGLPSCYEAYNVSDLTQQQSVALGDANPRGLWFAPDGYRFYYGGQVTTNIYQSILSTPYDISTVSSTSSFDTSFEVTALGGFAISADGTKMYAVDNTGNNIYQYTLSTAYDVTSASYDSSSFSVASETTSPFGIHYSDTYFYLCSGTTIYQYTWTPGDITTLVFNDSLVITGAALKDLFYRDTDKIYGVDDSNDTLYEVSMGNENISGGTVTDSATATAATGLFFDEGGFNLWLSNDDDDKIYEYWVGCP